MSNLEIKHHLYAARAHIGRAVMDIKKAKGFTGDGPHKHLAQQILLLTDVMKQLSPTDPHLDLE